MDVCWAGLPQQSSAVPNGKGKAADTESSQGTWVALVSGMELGGTEDADDLKADLLSEYLTGELAGDSVSPYYLFSLIADDECRNKYKHPKSLDLFWQAIRCDNQFEA